MIRNLIHAILLVTLLLNPVQAAIFPVEEAWHIEFDSLAGCMGRSWEENGHRLFVVGTANGVQVVSDGNVIHEIQTIGGKVWGVARAPSFGADSLNLLALIERNNWTYLSVLNPELDSILNEIPIDTVIRVNDNDPIAAHLYAPLIGINDSTASVFCSMTIHYTYEVHQEYYGDIVGYGEAREGNLYVASLTAGRTVEKHNLFWSNWGDLISVDATTRPIPITCGVSRGVWPYYEPGGHNFLEIPYGNMYLQAGAWGQADMRIRLEYIEYMERGGIFEFFTGCVGQASNQRTTFYTSYMDLAGNALTKCSYPPLQISDTLRNDIRPFKALVDIPARGARDEYLLGFTFTDSLLLINATQWAVVGEFAPMRNGIIAAEVIESAEDGSIQLALLDPSRLTLFNLSPLSVNDSPHALKAYTSYLCPYPNPFNSTTTISYTLPRSGRYSLTVTDITGREVARLAEGWKEAGSYREVWDGGGTAGGLFYLRCDAGGETLVRPLIYLK